MRQSFILAFIIVAAIGSLNLLIANSSHAEVASSGELAKAKPLTASTEGDAKAGVLQADSTAKLSKEKKSFAPLGSSKKATSAPLASPNKPKFMLKNATPGAVAVGNNESDRAAELQRLVDAYESIAIRYSDGLVLATTPEQKEAIAKHAPSARSLRSIARLIIDLVASNPKDEPALDGLIFLSKFIEVAEVEESLSIALDDGSKMDPMALLLEHHSSNPKISKASRRLPRGEETDIFLHKLVQKTYNPSVRWAAGAQLFSSHRRNNRTDAMEKLAVELSEDRYLEGVVAGLNLSARQWALNKVREIRTLGIGNVIPEVSGEKLDGDPGSITEYRGKVVVLDVWTTWCGPCRAMIPHHVHLAEQLKDKPFAILSVSCDRDKKTLEGFLADTDMPWDHWWVAPDSEFKRALNITSFPTIFVLDAKGVIRHKNVRDGQLEEAVEALLAEIEEPAATSEN